MLSPILPYFKSEISSLAVHSDLLLKLSLILWLTDFETLMVPFKAISVLDQSYCYHFTMSQSNQVKLITFLLTEYLNMP